MPIDDAVHLTQLPDWEVFRHDVGMLWERVQTTQNDRLLTVFRHCYCT